ncbi:hypothetical protein H8356DRAFT_1336415 [Neocallimastix lanati (nom. inval.)]|nr:hypothetical protein H8356DRAFT_1336415 [Neocallimastix sp. JGI-2020a]
MKTITNIIIIVIFVSIILVIAIILLVKESGQIKNVHITAINNCNKFYVCTYLVTFLTIKNLQKCVNNNGEAVFDLIEKVF